MTNTYTINDLVNVSFKYDYLDDVIKRVLKHEKVKNANFSIIFVDLKEIRKINNDYRGIDRETDVISFAFEDKKADFNLGIRLLGDIYMYTQNGRTS